MKLGTMIIGGSADGQYCPAKLVQMTVGKGDQAEKYLLMKFKEGAPPIEHHFYMLAGFVPAEAMKTFKVRAGLAKLDLPK